MTCREKRTIIDFKGEAGADSFRDFPQVVAVISNMAEKKSLAERIDSTYVSASEPHPGDGCPFDGDATTVRLGFEAQVDVFLRIGAEQRFGCVGDCL